MNRPHFSAFFRNLLTACCVLFSVVPVGSAFAGEIVVGQFSISSGVFAGTSQEILLGAKLWFDHVNAQGGVNGQKIRLAVVHGGYDSAEGVKLTEQMIDKEKPVALIGYPGTAILNELVKNGLLERSRIPLISPYSGSSGVRTYPWFFHIRATYTEEAAYVVEHVATLGIKKVAVLYQDDGFGQSVLPAFEAAAAKYGIQIVARGTYTNAKPDTSLAAQTIRAANPSAVVLIASTKPAATFIKEYKQAGGNAMIFGVSTVDSTGLVAQNGRDLVRGVAVTQIVPYPFSGVSKLVKEFQADFKHYAPAKAVVTYTVFEQYIGARLLVEALQRAGKNPSAAKVAEVLAGIGKVDIGGFALQYSSGNRSGSHFVDLTVIGPEGQLMR